MYAVLRVLDQSGKSGQSIKFNGVRSLSSFDDKYYDEIIVHGQPGHIIVASEYEFVQLQCENKYYLRSEHEPYLVLSNYSDFNSFVHEDHQLLLELRKGTSQTFICMGKIKDIIRTNLGISICRTVINIDILSIPPNDFGLIGIELIMDKDHLVKLGSIYINKESVDKYEKSNEPQRIY